MSQRQRKQDKKKRQRSRRKARKQKAANQNAFMADAGANADETPTRTTIIRRKRPPPPKVVIPKNFDVDSVSFDPRRVRTTEVKARTRMRAEAKISAHKALTGGLLGGIKKASTKPRRPFAGLTENGAVTLTTSGNPLLDFFFQVLPDSFAEQVQGYLTEAWEAEPLSALRLVFQLRDIRQGKGDREQFYVCLDWMAERHPETLLANLELFPQYGYWKDLLWFILRLIEGEEGRARRNARNVEVKRLREKNNARITKHKVDRLLRCGSDFDLEVIKKKRSTRRAIVDEATKKRACDVNIERNLAEGQAAKAAAHERRVQERAQTAYLVQDKLENDPMFAQFYNRVAELFAQQLHKDLETMKNGNPRDVTLCAKWAPRLGGSFDRRALLGRKIAETMFPDQTMADLPVDENAEEVKNQAPDTERPRADAKELSLRIACERYRKEVCVPLRRILECPEMAMSAGAWNKVNYERTPSVCMSKNAKHFQFRDKQRFEEYLLAVAKGEKKIASGAVMPHTLVMQCGPSNNQVADLQFQSIIRRLRESGSFSDSVAVCDVSGSMSGIPMEVAVALSLILAELNTGEWNNRMITFHENPTWFVVPPGNLHEKVKAIKRMPWGGSTNYHGVFTLIRNHAVAKGIAPADMIRRLYVFSDMEFNQSGGNKFETTHEQICREYREAGYEVPQIVFWNLRSGTSKAVPASASDKGVALVSGYNASLLKIFMDGTDADFVMEGGGNPEEVLETVLSSERYQTITKVVD